MRKGFTIHHNGPPARCIGQPHERCHRFWRGVRSFHMNDQGWSDIAYSFGVCPHGERFVGRGWDKRQFANGSDEVGVDNGPDSEWYSVLAFVGGDLSTRDEEVPTVSMIEGLAALIDEGRGDGHCDSQVKPHKDWKRKPCPGTVLTAFARTWDGKPFPEVAPPTPTKLPEEDPMFLYSTAGKPVMFCHAGVSVGLNEATDLPTMAANQLPHLRLDDDTFDAFLRSYPRAK